MNLNDLQNQGWMSDDSVSSAKNPLGIGNETTLSGTPWLARFALGIGAWLAGIFLTGFVFTSLQSAENRHSDFLITGLLIIAGSVAIARYGKGIFLKQLALAWSIAGYIVFFAGSCNFSTIDVWKPLFGAVILCPFIYWLSRNPVLKLFSVVWVWIFWLVYATMEGSSLLIFAATLAALAGVIIGLSGLRSEPQWHPFVTACVLALLLFPVFLSYSDVLLDRFSNHYILPLGIITALAFTGLLWHLVRPAIWQTICFGAVLIAIAFAGAPGVATGIGLMAAAHARRNRALEWVGIISLGVFLVQFYYQLNVSLMTKSLWLIGIGTGILILRFLALHKKTHWLPK